MRGFSARGVLASVGACLGVSLWAACAPPPEIRYVEAPHPSSGDSSAADPRLHPATRLWGDLMVEAGVVEVDTGARPWSSYWFPFSGNESEAALARYDRATGRSALAWFQKNRSEADRPPLPWEGRCDAWAFASLLVPEPLESRVAGGQRFEVWEQQALWIHAFEQLDPGARTILGNRNLGDGSSPFEDLFAMEFHQVLERMLRTERRPFVLDRDPRPAVWNTPIWGARWEILPEPSTAEDGTWLKVSTDVYGVLPLDHLPRAPERRTVVLHYDYRLKAVPVRGGRLQVVDSQWVGPSRLDHPDFVTLLDTVLDTAPVAHRSDNPEIDVEWLRHHFN